MKAILLNCSQCTQSDWTVYERIQSMTPICLNSPAFKMCADNSLLAVGAAAEFMCALHIVAGQTGLLLLCKLEDRLLMRSGKGKEVFFY